MTTCWRRPPTSLYRSGEPVPEPGWRCFPVALTPGNLREAARLTAHLSCAESAIRLLRFRIRCNTVSQSLAAATTRDPSICHRTVPSVRSAEGAQNGIFCRVLAICWRMRGEVQQPEPAAPSHEGMTTAVCVTASSANATMERLTTRGRWLGLSGHDYGRYAAILHLTVMIGIAFAQAHRTYGPAGRRTHVWGARIRVQTVLWHRSSRICCQGTLGTALPRILWSLTVGEDEPVFAGLTRRDRRCCHDPGCTGVSA